VRNFIFILLFFTLGLGIPFLYQGCGPAKASHYTPGPDYSTYTEYLPNYSIIWLNQMKRYPEIQAKVRSRIASYPPPLGWTIQVWQSGSFPAAQSPTGFAMGYCDYRGALIFVSLAQRAGETEEAKFIPAYEHEVDHAFGDASTGH